MSLRFFHILFIACSCLLSLVVGMWAIDAYRTDGSASWIMLAALALSGGAFLVVYGNRFLQKTRKLALPLFLVAGTLGVPTDLLACVVCVGDTQSSLREGMNAGILTLLGFAGFMIVSFAAFFIFLARKARHAPSLVGAAESSLLGAGFPPSPGPETDKERNPAHA
jgi:hypothetical protein